METGRRASFFFHGVKIILSERLCPSGFIRIVSHFVVEPLIVSEDLAFAHFTERTFTM